ncbi:MAG TPA: hypothetical protein VFI17_09095 [Solirubrobacterales bacterium]|nr:hypothetical protein [Solirubrobacterales bacterium]
MSNVPDPGPPDRDSLFAEAVEGLLRGFLPDEVLASVDGNHPAPTSATSPDVNQFQVQALRQAGLTAGQVEARIVKVEVDGLRRDVERLERELKTQAESSLSETRVYAIVFGSLGALVAMVALLGFVTGRF